MHGESRVVSVEKGQHLLTGENQRGGTWQKVIDNEGLSQVVIAECLGPEHEVVREWRIKAESGSVNDQRGLAIAYNDGDKVLEIDKDYFEAAYWFKKAAKQGDVFSQRQLALMYEHGLGVTQDYSEALHWYRSTAEQGDTTATVFLAGC